ncbi:hypothetical protein [Frischella perrara]|uniref:Uncharacterized protein n=1 Tax=Frischella perrara TaxID=1267021 RepID=A0A318N6U4_FRIPE|nr:hypothetical protein [Frischella perrara]PXY94388.1 hypothetical protein DKK76_10935 [Frischella perrara]
MRHIDHASLSFIIPKFYYHNAINAVDVLHQKTNVFVAMPDEVINKSYRYLTMVFCQIFRLLLIFSLMGSCVAWGNLSKQTENPIQGTAPYLLFNFKNGETRKVLNSDDLLYMGFYDGDKLKIYDIRDNPSEENIFIVPATVKTFEQILLPIPLNASYNTGNFQFISLDELSSKWGVDDDGDRNFIGKGNLKVRITSEGGNTAKRYEQFVACDSPYYKIHLIISGAISEEPAILTKYGNPERRVFSEQDIKFFVRHIIEPSACWVKPNMTSNGGASNRDNYNGPVEQWDFSKGFSPQNIDQPSLNFPTSGMDNLSFQLTMAETKVNDMTYTTEPSNSELRLAITPVSDDKKVIAKITLHGPNSSTTPPPQNTFIPTTFTIFTDNSKKTKLYTFKIAKWFIVKPNSNDNKKGVIYSEAKEYCNNIGYKLPLIGDLTNGNAPDIAWKGGLLGQPNNYQRRIGGGLLAEWGEISQNYYPDNNVTSMYFWGDYNDDDTNNSYKYRVSIDEGVVSRTNVNTITAQAICVSP